MGINKPYEELGLLIRSKRKEKGLTQEQLTEKLNCAKRNISFWENGERKPSLNYIYALCELLDLKPTDFDIPYLFEYKPPKEYIIEENKKEASLKLTDYLLQNFDTSFMNQHDIELFAKSASTKIENTYIDILTRKSRKCKDTYLTGAYHNIYKCELLSYNEEYYTLENISNDGITYTSCHKLDDDFNKVKNIEYIIYPLIIHYKNKDFCIDWIIEQTNNTGNFSKHNMSEAQAEKYKKFREKISIK